ncbi:Pentatricopeptide repeat-containing protein [Quillaja saponaria]|uniref:Pentatricopeptide repeat-containing protein n=1 Tax=Quillaja saponaria TaxID=32244 RepID=A0AAD7L227_QUISA|nr:Pentatricopeptide repeat-containing protein [Quillaja saponaria]
MSSPTSQFFQSSIQSALLKNPFFFHVKNRSNCDRIPRRRKPVILAKLVFSPTSNPTENTLQLLVDKANNLQFDERSDRLRVQNLVDKIRALPNKSKCELVNIFEKDGDFPTVSAFNDMLMALVISDLPQVALKLFSDLSSYELVPDCWTYSIMVRCYCEKNDLDEAKRVLYYMLENGFQPNVATITILIHSFCKRGRMQKAFEVFELMDSIGCKPTIQTYNCLLKGFCYVGKVEEAFEMLMDIKKSSLKPDIYTYTAVMDGFCKVGRSDEARELLGEAMEMGLAPNVVIFNTLFTGYSKEGRPLEGIGILKQMKKRQCFPDYISYSTLLHGLLKWDKILAALGVYKEMVGLSFEVDERKMNTLLRGLCKKSMKKRDLLEDANKVFEKMLIRKLKIDRTTYGLMIQVLCAGKKHDDAFINLNDMIRMGYSPRTLTFDKVIQALCAGGKIHEAVRTLVLMYEHRRLPSKTSYNLLINKLNKQHSLFGACNLYAAALKRGVVSKCKPQCKTVVEN